MNKDLQSKYECLQQLTVIVCNDTIGFPIIRYNKFHAFFNSLNRFSTKYMKLNKLQYLHVLSIVKTE